MRIVTKLPASSRTKRISTGSKVESTGGANQTSGDAQFRLTRGTESTEHPMAPDGDVYWFGYG